MDLSTYEHGLALRMSMLSIMRQLHFYISTSLLSNMWKRMMFELIGPLMHFSTTLNRCSFAHVLTRVLIDVSRDLTAGIHVTLPDTYHKFTWRSIDKECAPYVVSGAICLEFVVDYQNKLCYQV